MADIDEKRNGWAKEPLGVAPIIEALREADARIDPSPYAAKIPRRPRSVRDAELIDENKVVHTANLTSAARPFLSASTARVSVAP